MINIDTMKNIDIVEFKNEIWEFIKGWKTSTVVARHDNDAHRPIVFLT